MARICVFTSKATSLLNVAKDIAYVIHKKGEVPRVFTTLLPAHECKRICDKAVYVMTMSPTFATHWILHARDLFTKSRLTGNRIPVLFYTTIEGRLKRFLVKPWMKSCVPYIANSKYTREKLEEAGFRIHDVVYHGVNMEEVEMAKNYIARSRRKLEEKFGIPEDNGIIFGAILSDHPRKGLNHLIRAFKKAREKDNNIYLYVLTPKALPPIDGIIVDNNFGKYGKVEILALIGSFDYLIIPSFTEGFGLPLIEANAMGVPVIHCNYPPLSEITCSGNITFPYDSVSYLDVEEGIEYELHMYSPDTLAEKILEASRIAREEKETYFKMVKAVMDHAKSFDVTVLYNRLLDILDRVVWNDYYLT